jgi:hypothetical protein
MLAIAGGGIRGILPAMMLAERKRRAQQPVCALFDLLAGIATGGILALGLGLLTPTFDAREGDADAADDFCVTKGNLWKLQGDTDKTRHGVTQGDAEIQKVPTYFSSMQARTGRVHSQRGGEGAPWERGCLARSGSGQDGRAPRQTPRKTARLRPAHRAPHANWENSSKAVARNVWKR